MRKSAGATASKTVWLTACAACRSASHAADKRADTHVAYEPLKALDGGSTPPISTKVQSPRFTPGAFSCLTGNRAFAITWGMPGVAIVRSATVRGGPTLRGSLIQLPLHACGVGDHFWIKEAAIGNDSPLVVQIAVDGKSLGS